LEFGIWNLTLASINFEILIRELNQSLNSWIKRALKNLKAETVTFTHETAETAYRMQEPFHKDPADRILVATAVLENLSLMTADERILNYKHLSAVNARE
jgi:PIN domain nuclease of toxin-antitoxin system